jgi:hypothetical protein
VSFSETLSLVASLAFFAAMFAVFFFAERGRWQIVECELAEISGGPF